MTGSVHVTEIEWDQGKEASEMGEAQEYAVHLCEAGKLFSTTTMSGGIKITLEPSSFEIYSFVPIKELGLQGAKFAPIGLTNMFNSGGTIQGLEYNGSSVEIEVKGGGNFLAYSNVAPKKCCLNGAETVFKWSGDDGRLVLNLAWNEEANGISHVTFAF